MRISLLIVCIAGLTDISFRGLRAEDAAAVRHRLLVGDDSTGRIALLAADGKTEWEHKVGPIHDLDLLGNGNVLFQLSWTRLVEVEPKTKKVVWTFKDFERFGNSLPCSKVVDR